MKVHRRTLIYSWLRREEPFQILPLAGCPGGPVRYRTSPSLHYTLRLSKLPMVHSYNPGSTPSSSGIVECLHPFTRSFVAPSSGVRGDSNTNTVFHVAVVFSVGNTEYRCSMVAGPMRYFSRYSQIGDQSTILRTSLVKDFES